MPLLGLYICKVSDRQKFTLEHSCLEDTPNVDHVWNVKGINCDLSQASARYSIHMILSNTIALGNIDQTPLVVWNCELRSVRADLKHWSWTVPCQPHYFALFTVRAQAWLASKLIQ